MHFFKATCSLIILVCGVYTADCTLGVLQDGLARVANEVTPVLDKIDNSLAVANNIIGGITSTIGNRTALADMAQPALGEVTGPFADAIDTLTGAPQCVSGAAASLAELTVQGTVRFVGCGTSAASQLPALMTQLQALVLARGLPAITDLASNLERLVSTLLGGSSSVNSAIDSVVSQVADILSGLTSLVSQLIQVVLSALTCIVNLKLWEIQEGMKILNDIVSCAASAGVSVPAPVPPAQPSDPTVIINEALAAYGDETTVSTETTIYSQAYRVSARIVKAGDALNGVSKQVAAATPAVITEVISGAVQPFVSRLELVKSTYWLNYDLQADVQNCIDRLTTIQNNGVVSATMEINQNIQQVNSLQQWVVTMNGELNQLVRNEGVSAIMECANNASKSVDELRACVDKVLENSQLKLDGFNSELETMESAAGVLSGKVPNILPSQANVAYAQAMAEFDNCKAMLRNKYNVII